ncbi:hypothetical protein GOBAR_AA22528 [Gossypium barbadense]|uniref:RNase H type-1 domain-containing protein n=1 Tax=Gossypium barbadense TaxID=3634 RepID=A0A2P5X462_GOSBA|nr:hypothetical protein GOBAR_AA22528 [Gossypium barbadense]
MVDDASSSSSSSTIDGPLFHLSELMAQLPIKRGLSKYFQGKSQTFTSLSSVNTVEELAKKETPFYRKKLKACKSHKLYTPPRATIVQMKLSKYLAVGLNTIDSLKVRQGSGFVAIRGVMRDQNERWILGYNMYLGFRSVMEAELWGILNGLTLLLEQNYDTVLIQTDSMEAILAIHEFG